MLCTVRGCVLCRSNNLVIPGEEIEEYAVNTNIRDEENTSGRGEKSFMQSTYQHLGYLKTNALQQNTNTHYQCNHYHTATVYHGHQYIANMSLSDHSTVQTSHPEDCLHTYCSTANGMAGGADGPHAPSHALHRGTGLYVLHSFYLCYNPISVNGLMKSSNACI